MCNPAVLSNTDLSNDLPYNEYFSHYGGDFKLHTPIVDHSLVNANSRAYLDSIKARIFEQLRCLNGAPSVQMQNIPPPIAPFLTDSNGKDLPDSRPHTGSREHPAERYDGDADNDSHDPQMDYVDIV